MKTLEKITKFSQLSIFSELNNISNISMDDEYAGICGITKEELLTYYNREFNYYTLDLPNKEVKVGLTKALIPSYVTRNTLATTNTARRIAQCLAKQDMEGALQLLKTYLGTVPYCDNTHYEGHYQQVLYIIFSLLADYLVDVEVHTPTGRVDIVMLSRTNLYIIEIKMDKDAQAAMQQIDLKQYDKRFALCGKPTVKVGINFDTAKGNIEDWAINC